MSGLICNGCNTTIPAHEDIPHLAACTWHVFGNGWKPCTHEADECFRAGEGIAA